MRVRDAALACAVLCAGYGIAVDSAALAGRATPEPADAVIAASEGRPQPRTADDRQLEELGRELDRLGREAGREAQKTLEQALSDVRKHLQALSAAGAAGWAEALETYRNSLREYERAQKDAETEPEI